MATANNLYLTYGGMTTSPLSSSSPPTQLSLSPESFTPPTTRQRRTILVKMGPCNWQGKNDDFQCLCTSGSCTSDWNASQASCDNCMHPMSLHSDYGILHSAALNPTTVSHAPSRRITPFGKYFIKDKKSFLIGYVYRTRNFR